MTTDLILTSRTDPKSVLNLRGYAFNLPTLGLPDPEGEWVIIKAAIGLRDQALPLVTKYSVAPAVRYAYQGCGMLDVEYQGAVWILPLVGPHKLNEDAEAELFLLKTRRLPLSSSRKHCRTKLPNGDNPFHLVHRKGMAQFEVSTRTTVSDDKAFWAMELSQDGEQSEEEEVSSEEEGPLSAFDHIRAHLPELIKVVKDKEKNVIEWDESPQSALEEAWYTKTMRKAIQDAKLTRTPISPRGPGFSLRSLPCGEGARFDYAILLDDREVPRFDEWRRLPMHAFKPGRALSFTNQVRKHWGKRPLTEKEWTEMQKEASPPPTPRRSRRGEREEKV